MYSAVIHAIPIFYILLFLQDGIFFVMEQNKCKNNDLAFVHYLLRTSLSSTGGKDQITFHPLSVLVVICLWSSMVLNFYKNKSLVRSSIRFIQTKFGISNFKECVDDQVCHPIWPFWATKRT